MTTKLSPNRLNLLNRGINMNNLMWGTNKHNSFTDADIAPLHAMNIKNVRLVIEIGYILPGFNMMPNVYVSTPETVSKSLLWLDRCVETFISNGFVVTLVPWMNDQFKILTDFQAMSTIAAMNDIFTGRYAYKYAPYQLFFDIVNEPQFTTDFWNAITPKIVARMRKTALKHTIIVEPAHYEVKGYPLLVPLQDQNIIYAMHIYQPSSFTFQGQPGSPIIDGLVFPNLIDTYAKVEKEMHVAIDWSIKNNVPLILQEFGCSNLADSQSRINWLTCVRQIAEKNNIPWTFWGFAGRSMGLKPTIDSAYDQDLVKVLT